MVLISHQPNNRTNARLSYERSAEGAQIRVYATSLLRDEEEIYAFYG